MAAGNGFCGPGEVYSLQRGEIGGGPEMAEIMDIGDAIYEATLAAEAYALGPYSKASVPAPSAAARPGLSRGRPRTPVSSSG